MILSTILSLVLYAASSMADSAGWLDRPLANWNRPAAGIPKAPSGDEPRDALLKRCSLTLRQTTPSEKALAAAGWTPFLQFDRAISQGDVEVVYTMSRADKLCQPARFNGFVFVAGHFAGTLSPDLMSAGHDGAAGVTRLIPPDAASTDFARYGPSDSECCPTAHLTVRYKIDRSGAQPLVVPSEIRKTRG